MDNDAYVDVELDTAEKTLVLLEEMFDESRGDSEEEWSDKSYELADLISSFKKSLEYDWDQ